MDEQEEEGCRKYTDDEGSMETDTALSEFPAFADNNARQPESPRLILIEFERARHSMTEKNKRINLGLLDGKKKGKEEKQNGEGERNEERSAYASSTSGRNATGKQSDIVCR
ncbi:uncharacterized protein LOC126853888 [Cataglyphis hispanica]|uniref:uncharacterized protein LOC126853888 n=1 Tax=Cataglyphis hispanica TaxID=1086592 RepID=UPI0021801E46|nr:uncharacterized protein LOC126853888 [Cataglyphis hispanica]